ncbi:MAG TPA: glycosyltransferase [Vicinamibacterales bacterium]|nr:glycosyltransferase [Vicinamibacterales bacterium]
MKILRIIARLNVGGPARHVALLNAGLQARGHATCLAYGALAPGEASLERPALESGIPLIRIEDLGRSVRAASDLRAFIALLRLMFREQPDVVHTHTAKAGTLGRIAAFIYNRTRRRARRALVVHTFHGHVFEGYFGPGVNRLVRATERRLARLSDVIVTISPRQRDDIVGRFAVANAAQTVVVPLGLDLDALFDLAPEAHGFRADIGAAGTDVVVGYVGRMVPVKDLTTLLLGFALALAEVPALRLVLAGDGTERAAAVALAAELRIDRRVHFLGWVDDLPAFYSSIDLFALSSLNEGTPVAAIEAMAAAKPVVATSVGGVPDVVDADASGLLVAARDVIAFSRALVDLASSPERRLKMGHAGRAIARARYSHVRLVTEIEALYERGLADKRACASHDSGRV